MSRKRVLRTSTLWLAQNMLPLILPAIDQRGEQLISVGVLTGFVA